jgi:MFS transporter, ACS family, hexuronate transporter
VSVAAADSTPRRAGWAVAIAATLGMSVSYIDRQALAAIAPAVRAALHIDHTQFGWLVSAFSMAYLVGAPAAGALVDRLGARRGFAAALVVWSFVAGAHALATSFAVLFALRVLLGAAESPSFPAAAQAIRRSLPGARRPAAYGLLFTGSSIGAMIAAPLAIHLEGRFGFRSAFVGTACAGAMWLPFWLFVTRGGRLPAEAPAPATPAAAPSAWRDVARSAPVLRALVAVIGAAPTIMFAQTWAAQYLVEHWKLPRTGISGYLLVPPLLFDLGAVGFGWLASRRETGAPRTHRDLLLTAAVLGSMLALSPFAPSPGVAMALFGAAACGGGGVYVLVTADMLARVPPSRTSSAGGMTAAAQSIALVAANPLIGLSVDRTHDYVVATVALGLMVLPATLVFLLWPSLRDR